MNVSAASGNLTLETGLMYEGQAVEIKVVLLKDTRRVEASQIMYVILGDPPMIRMKCVTNCKPKFNYDARLSLESVIDGWTRGVYFYYNWTLYAVPSGGWFFTRY